MRSTRTSLSYFSPNSAIAPAATAPSYSMTRVSAGALARICAFTSCSICSSSCGVTGLEVREVEAQPVGRDQRALLLHVRAEHLAQRRVQQVRRRCD